MLGGNEMINKLVRVLGLGLMIATFAFIGFAQDRTREIVYKQYIDNYQSNETAKLQLALDAAKEYVEKFKEPTDSEQSTYFKDAIPTLEKAIGEINTKGKADAERKEWYALLGKVEAANKAKNWAEVYSNGKQAIDKQTQYLDAATVKSEKLDLAIILGVAGFDRAFEKNDTFNNDALTYLKSSVQQIEAGQTSKSFGLLGYELKDKDNALGLLNYYIGYITYYRQNKKDEALPYFYKSTQYKSAARDFPAIYNVIGLKFYNRLAELDKTRLAAVEAAPEKKDTPETLAMLAEEKGVAERGIEAFSKAFKLASADAKTPEQFKKDIRANLEDLYKFRFGNTDGVDAYINTVAAKPLTNPNDPIKPVVEEEKPAETTTTTSTTTTPAATPATTKPTTAASTTATKPATSGTTTTKTTTPTTATKPAATKKPRRR